MTEQEKPDSDATWSEEEHLRWMLRWCYFAWRDNAKLPEDVLDSVLKALDVSIAATGPGKPANGSDPVNSPAHYTHSAIEPIQVVEAWRLGFCLGNTVKYVCRAGRKPGSDTIEDLRKAAWYLRREISRLEQEKQA